MTWWSEHSAVPRFVLAELAIRCRCVDRFVGSRVPSHVSGQRLSTQCRPPSLDRVPASPVPRLHQYYEGATTSRPREPGPLWFRFQAPRAPPVFVFAVALLTSPEEARQARNIWSAGVPIPGMAHPWARAGSHRFPGDPSHAFALLQDPGRAGKISPWRSCRCCPRSTQTEGLSGHIISRLTQGFSIRCLRFTSDVTATHARLASGRRAAPLPGGRRTLWITSKGFRLHPFSFPGLLLSQGWSMPSGPLADPTLCSPTCPVTRTGSPSPTAGSSPSTASQ